MLIAKITTGFVVQTFDTDTNKYTDQEFTAGEVEYENEIGEPVDQTKVMPNPEPYLPFDMVQPED